MICILERISRQTCESLNQAHAQTALQALAKEGLEALVDLEKAAHPEAALICDRLLAVRKELLACCPPKEEKPEPRCVYRPCRPGEGGTKTGAGERLRPSRGRAARRRAGPRGRPYPPAKPPSDPAKRANKQPAPRIPTGPFRGFLTPGVEHKPLDIKSGGGPLGSGDDPVVFGTYTNFGGFSAPQSTVAADISGAERGSVVLSTGNKYAAYSTDGGVTFTAIDPTTVFDNSADGGFCCDQIVQYAPSIDRFLWLMQFSSGSNGKNRLRIASASPETVTSSKCTSWTYWDLTCDTFGITNWLDYWNLSVGDSNLYVGIDSVGSSNAGRIIIRIPLSDIAAGVSINFRYTTDPTKSANAYSSHVSQNTGDEAYWAGNKNNSTITVFNWNEDSTSYSWRDVGVNNWPNGTLKLDDAPTGMTGSRSCRASPTPA